MNIVRKNLPVLVLAAIAPAFIIVTTTLSSAAPSLAPRMTPVTLANGLLFNQGPAARYLTSASGSAGVPAGSAARVESLVDAALRAHPGLAGAFARDVQSGDRVKVTQALVSLWGLAQSGYASGYGIKIQKIAVARAQAALRTSAVMADLSEFPGSGSGWGSGSGSDGNDYQYQLHLQYENWLAWQRVLVRGYFIWTKKHHASSAMAMARLIDLVAADLHD